MPAVRRSPRRSVQRRPSSHGPQVLHRFSGAAVRALRVKSDSLEVFVRRISITGILPVLAAATLIVAVPRLTHAQAPAQQAQAAASPLGKDEIKALAKVAVDIGHAQDTAQARLAMSRNKANQAQAALREGLRLQIDTILHHAGMTEV